MGTKEQDKLKCELTRGNGRTKINLSAEAFGDGIIVTIYNENEHIGAVAVGEYDLESHRASISVLTRLGHKDDIIAQKAAYLISKHMHGPSCIIAGVHLDNITEKEIDDYLRNADLLVGDLLKYWSQTKNKGVIGDE